MIVFAGMLYHLLGNCLSEIKYWFGVMFVNHNNLNWIVDIILLKHIGLELKLGETFVAFELLNDFAKFVQCSACVDVHPGGKPLNEQEDS